MSEDEKVIIKALNDVVYLPGSWNKRFMSSMISLLRVSLGDELSIKQVEWVYRLLYRYRRQVPGVYERYKGHEFCNKKER